MWYIIIFLNNEVAIQEQIAMYDAYIVFLLVLHGIHGYKVLEQNVNFKWSFKISIAL